MPYSSGSIETRGAHSLFSLACTRPRAPILALAHMQIKPRVTTETGVSVIGAPRTTLRDFYYVFLKVRWSMAIAVLVVAYLALNAVFASAYLVLGGIANARPGSF